MSKNQMRIRDVLGHIECTIDCAKEAVWVERSFPRPQKNWRNEIIIAQNPGVSEAQKEWKSMLKAENWATWLCMRYKQALNHRIKIEEKNIRCGLQRVRIG